MTNCGSILAYSLLRIVEGVASGLIVLIFDLPISELSLICSVGNHGQGLEALPRWIPEWYAYLSPKNPRISNHSLNPHLPGVWWHETEKLFIGSVAVSSWIGSSSFRLSWMRLM